MEILGSVATQVRRERNIKTFQMFLKIHVFLMFCCSGGVHSDNSKHPTLFLPGSLVWCDTTRDRTQRFNPFLVINKIWVKPSVQSLLTERGERGERERSDLNKYNSAQIRDYSNPQPTLVSPPEESTLISRITTKIPTRSGKP